MQMPAALRERFTGAVVVMLIACGSLGRVRA